MEFLKDQKNRKNGLKNIVKSIDRNNLELVISLYEKCGEILFEGLTERQIHAIWLVIQH